MSDFAVFLSGGPFMLCSLSRRSVLAALAASGLVSGLSVRRARGQGAPASPAAERGNAQPAEVIDHPRARSFEIGPTDAPWRIFLGLPEGDPPARGWSLVLSTDGNATFPMLWHHRERTAPGAPVLLASIGYPGERRFDTVRRRFDLTSPGMVPVGGLAEGQRGPGRDPTGGREALLDLIEHRLLDEIAARAPVDREDMTLFGHSLGGHFTMHAFYSRTWLFRRFSAADPSGWWNSGEIELEERAFRAGVRAAGGRLARATVLMVTGSAGRLPAEGEAPRELVAPPWIERLAGIEGLEIGWKGYPGESHGSLLGPAARRTLDLHLGRIAGPGAP
ncbi:alpha/beta hydrolase [Pseudogemmobacter sonorensis]|uniref:alpha/beta hydrolase n=1 Tax=Pseudogemmobacter sonorensis TaxID=2989681 RepID=UPI00369E5292